MLVPPACGPWQVAGRPGLARPGRAAGHRNVGQHIPQRRRGEEERNVISGCLEHFLCQTHPPLHTTHQPLRSRPPPPHRSTPTPHTRPPRTSPPCQYQSLAGRHDATISQVFAQFPASQAMCAVSPWNTTPRHVTCLLVRTDTSH